MCIRDRPSALDELVKWVTACSAWAANRVLDWPNWAIAVFVFSVTEVKSNELICWRFFSLNRLRFVSVSIIVFLSVPRDSVKNVFCSCCNETVVWAMSAIAFSPLLECREWPVDWRILMTQSFRCVVSFVVGVNLDSILLIVRQSQPLQGANDLNH